MGRARRKSVGQARSEVIELQGTVMTSAVNPKSAAERVSRGTRAWPPQIKDGTRCGRSPMLRSLRSGWTTRYRLYEKERDDENSNEVWTPWFAIYSSSFLIVLFVKAVRSHHSLCKRHQFGNPTSCMRSRPSPLSSLPQPQPTSSLRQLYRSPR